VQQPKKAPRKQDMIEKYKPSNGRYWLTGIVCMLYALNGPLYRNLLPIEVIHALRHLVAHLVDNAVCRGVFKLGLERVRVIRAVRRIHVSVLFVRILCVRFWHRLSNGNAS